MTSSQSSGYGMQALMDHQSSSPVETVGDAIMLAIPQLYAYSQSWTMTQTQEEDPDLVDRSAYLRWLVKPTRVYRGSPLLK